MVNMVFQTSGDEFHEIEETYMQGESVVRVVDFGSGKMRILGGRWTEIERGKQDAMHLRLAATFNSIEDFENPQFDLRAKDDDHDDACSLQDFLQDLRAAERYEEIISEVQFTDDASENEFVDVETYVNVDEQIPEEHFHAHELTERTQCSMSKTWSWIQGQLVETSKKAAQFAYEGNHQHARIEGGSRCKKAENYQCELAWNLVRTLLEDEDLSEQAYTVQQDAETQELTGVLRKLGTRHGSEAVCITYRLHRNLGHPRKDTLVRMLQAKNADPKVIAAAKALECPYCNKFSSRKQSAPAHAERPMDFNEQLQADTLWFDLSSVEPDAPSDKVSKRKVSMLVMVVGTTTYSCRTTLGVLDAASLAFTCLASGQRFQRALF
ncbi:unnamed protein product [Cladocopium goreaui]|uniref:Eukaryotic translation initiation factor isoform 4G-2 n=1 Tax=Cladocopium goreaui TaxID=2562237 RepID=A0A9P1DQV2_9DINO|nr:unnamed protein product [Cladocopium goreaui]